MPADADLVAEAEIQAVLADIDANPWPDDVVSARLLYDQMGPPIAADIAIRPVQVGGVRARTLTPPRYDRQRAVLFLHGGGYVYGSLASHAGMAAEIGRAAAAVCLQLDYRLAPEHPYPAALEDTVAAYEWLLAQGYPPERIALVGDSAGGGLALATLLELTRAGHPHPGAVGCISPWVDLEATGESYRTRQAVDPIVERELSLRVAGLYLDGRDPRMPTASPLHADLRGFPPLLIQVGECEVMFSEAAELAARARSAGVDVTFEEWPRMVHVWHLYYPILAAGRAAIGRIGEFIQDKTGIRTERPYAWARSS
jgi:epsilon-lactone hydrolase